MNDIFSKRVLSVDEVATLTGFSRAYVYKLVTYKLIPYSKPLGGKLFFDRVAVEDWMLGKSVPTKREMEIKSATYCKTGKL